MKVKRQEKSNQSLSMEKMQIVETYLQFAWYGKFELL